MGDYNKLVAILGDTLLLPGGTSTVSTREALKTKTVGLYFSAAWNPPARDFTPLLAEKYAALNEAGKNFEIVFVSSDRDEATFEKYRGEMPWPALPFGTRNSKSEIWSQFQVRGVPALVILDADGELINGDGRGAVGGESYIEEFPYISSSTVFFDSCLGGNARQVKSWLKREPDYVNSEATPGWHARHVLGAERRPVYNPPRVVKAPGKDMIAAATGFLEAKHPARGLHVAAANGHSDVVRVLLDAGADVEAEDGDGGTALAWATYCGRRDTMKLLLAAGADPAFCNGISKHEYEEVRKGDGASLEYLQLKMAKA